MGRGHQTILGPSGRVLRTHKLRSSPLKTQSMRVLSLQCFAHCLEFLPCHNFFLFGPFTFFLFKTLSLPFNCVSFDVRNFRVVLRSKECPFQFWQSFKKARLGVCMSRYGKRLQTLPPHPTLGEAVRIFHTWHCLIRKSKVIVVIVVIASFHSRD